jgi:hypothetical protein
MCSSKGFKAVLVEHANQANYDFGTLGFTAPNTSYQQYYQWLSGAARSYGMAFGLHSGSDLVENNPYFVTFLDFASSSSCWGGGFCDLYVHVKDGEPAGCVWCHNGKTCCLSCTPRRAVLGLCILTSVQCTLHHYFTVPDEA